MNRGRAQDKALLNMLTENAIHTNLEMTKEELRVLLDKVIVATNIILEEDKIAGL
jgi:kynurenine 3-monooxygenase